MSTEHEPASQIRRGEQPPLVVQIAREAADRIMYWQQHHGLSQDRSYLIIRDAIEKAHQSGWHEGRQYQVEYGTPAQPQRSEQATLASEAAEKAAKQLLNEAEWHEDNVISVSGEIEPFISEALRKQQLPLIEGYIRMFVEAILHGSDEHRLWLKEAGECFINGKPMPERPCPCIAPASGAASGTAVAGSEPQEEWWWIEEDVDGFWHIGVGNRAFADLGDGADAEATAIAIKDAHNAAIAAELERRKQAEQLRDDVLLREVKLIRQLLAAQAAIEKHNRNAIDTDECLCPIDADLSALLEHDAEVRKPLVTENLRLVEALEECVAALDTAQLRHARASKSHVEAWKHGKAALAQAKEQP